MFLPYSICLFFFYFSHIIFSITFCSRSFAIYEGIELKEIYKLTPQDLEPYYITWEKKWHDTGGKDINNPKIPLKYVRDKGKLLYHCDERVCDV
ncbi:hypothetical protein [Wolbachia endosymbiont (group A) of Conops quadrifasciatus]|uniref:hypothetical protein n=1 Tax=Wolbachia endosymbiont (group A) of Conops quadrifasciatus TaxID=3066143 RepID=UPI00397DEB0E